MFNINTESYLSLLLTACFSFFILTLALCIKKVDPLSKLLGVSFFIPFFFSLASFLSYGKIMSDALLNLLTPSLSAALLILLVSKPEKKHHATIKAVLFILPPVITALVFSSTSLSGYLAASHINLYSLAAAFVLTAFVLRKRKAPWNTLIWASLCLTLGEIVRNFAHSGNGIYFYLTATITAYLLFMSFFKKEYIDVLVVKVSAAEQKMSDVNRMLELEVKKRTFEIEKVNEKLLSISKTDFLSKTLNKAAIIDVIDNMILSRIPEFSILMFDIDDFKKINDTRGHIEGDMCIKKLSLIARSSIRDIDKVGRYGGDEFIIVLPGISIQQARLVAERFRKKVEDNESPRFTVSIGIATYPGDAKTSKDLIKMADDGLYKSKARGKNTVSHGNRV